MTRSLVTFDFHNTLVACDAWFQTEIAGLPDAVFPNESDEILASVRAEYRKIRADVVATGIERSAESTVIDLRDQFGIRVDDQTLRDRLHACMDAFVEHATAIEGAVETLEQLAVSGYPIGVVSSAVYHRFLERALEQLGMAKHLDFVSTSASVGRYKSDPRLYSDIMRIHQAEPKTSIHIGDSARWDVASAAAAGMRTVLYDPPTALPGSHGWDDASPDWTVSDLRDVVPIIRSHLDPT